MPLKGVLDMGYYEYPLIGTDIGCGPDYGPIVSAYGHEKPLARSARSTRNLLMYIGGILDPPRRNTYTSCH